MTIASALLAALASGALQTAPAQTAPVQSQTTPPVAQEDQEDDQPSGASAPGDADYVLPEVQVAGTRGRVQGDIEPEITLDSGQLIAYGATNVAELLAALEPLTRSNRGRGGGGPVVLLNGRRTSGFQEIRTIPFEAIERTEILPEEAGLAYGFGADQRVVNIVLKANFTQANADVSYRAPTQGGRNSTEVRGGYFSIVGGNRLNVSLEREHDTALFETERDIVRDPGSQPFDRIGNVAGIPYGAEIDPALSTLAGRTVTVAANPGVSNPTLAGFAAGANSPRTGDLTQYRTLLPRGDETTLNASLARDLNETIKGTISLNLEQTTSFSYLGLPGVTLTAPAGRNGSPFTRDVAVYRYIDDPFAVTRDNETTTANLGLLLDGFLADWRWTLSGSYDRVETDTVTGRGLSATAAQAAVTAGTLNPFGTLDPSRFTRLVDTANSVSSGGSVEANFNGDLWALPAGDMSASFKVGVDTRDLSSESTRSGVFTDRTIGRDRVYGSTNLTLPISNGVDVLRPIGDVSLTLNASYDEASDIGGLTTWGASINWSPIDPLGVIVSYTNEDGAPSISQLNDPTISTPNSAVFDFRTGETVLVNRITGGNPGLTPDNRQVWKVGVNWRANNDLSFRSDYTRTSIDGAIVAFPSITPDLEAALPERFTRDATGRLIQLDARPLNFSQTERSELRSGFNFSRSFGRPNFAAASGPGAAMGAIMFGGGGRPPGAGGPGAGGPPGGGGQFRFGGPGGGGGGGGAQPRGGGGGGGMLPGQGRFNLSVFHTVRFTDEVTIRPGLPVLDLLDGDATGANGGTPRNEVQVQGGVFRNGFGAFLNANWRQGTEVDGGVGGSTLNFSDRTTVNLTMFADLNQRTTWVERFPILRGSRVSLSFENIFDSRTEVTSSTGDVPLNYQPDFLDPEGRVVRISLRKILF
ncbi:TonB-dependent receptor [Brevundimonas bacteroides]|uniref:TonB-dependent receptor plug domain-containing protein n=1 Tax=Brevundimonas bacteroides TaxID=74311 RepID=UPI0004974E8C|nr:TonB-dependent receptor plug domain-containing protein [Brevundimonas bacteroides]